MGSEQLNRREFAGRIAAGAAVPLIAAATAVDAAEAAQKPDDAKPLSPVERLLELIRQQYPDRRLDDAGIAEIRDVVAKLDMQEALQVLADLANERGGFDNITAVLVHIIDK